MAAALQSPRPRPPVSLPARLAVPSLLHHRCISKCATSFPSLSWPSSCSSPKRHFPSPSWPSSCSSPKRHFPSPASSQGFSVEQFEDEEEVGEGVVPAPPPTPGRIDIVVTKEHIRQLDLSPVHKIFRKYVHRIGDNATDPAADVQELFERTVGFVLEYEVEDPLDPRELSELPDIRLWFVRLDAAYPWLPIVVDWRAGELSRYAAMLVPHQMSKRLGLVYNPEALELWAMQKLFVIHEWLKARKVAKPDVKLNNMLRMIGFSISDELYGLVEKYPHP